MTPDHIMTLGRQAIEVTVMVAAPLLLVALVIGLIVSIFQAATQINEATLSFIPKLLGIFATLLLAGPWMLGVLTDYLRTMLTSLPSLAG
jgi:flagellar biosynthesis protein FliQ